MMNSLGMEDTWSTTPQTTSPPSPTHRHFLIHPPWKDYGTMLLSSDMGMAHPQATTNSSISSLLMTLVSSVCGHHCPLQNMMASGSRRRLGSLPLHSYVGSLSWLKLTWGSYLQALTFVGSISLPVSYPATCWRRNDSSSILFCYPWGTNNSAQSRIVLFHGLCPWRHQVHRHGRVLR
jgi:hypothetical protein